MKSRREIRDIYRHDHPDFNETAGSGITQKLIADKQRKLEKTQMAAHVLSGAVLFFGTVLIALELQTFFDEKAFSRLSYTENTKLQSSDIRSEEKPAIVDPDDLETASTQSDDTGYSAREIKSAAFRISAGIQALSIKNTTDAIKQFEEALRICPDITGLHRILGMIFTENKNYKEAAYHLERALNEEEDFNILNTMGTACFETGEYEKAEKHFLRAIELQPENAICYKKLARTYQSMEQPEKANNFFEKYLNLKPDDFEIMQEYIFYLTKQGENKTAEELLKKMTENVTNVAPIYFALARVQIQNGQTEEAVGSLSNAVKLIDQSSALTWLSKKDFDAIRDTEGFIDLTDRIRNPDKTTD